MEVIWWSSGRGRGCCARFMATMLMRSGFSQVKPFTSRATARKDGYFWVLGRIDDVLNVAATALHDGVESAR